MSAATTTPQGTAIALTGMRKVAARRMVEAWAAPVFHLQVDVDMSAVLAADLRSQGATVTDVILAACASALAANPNLNAHFADTTLTTFSDVNLGLAVATDAGLTVPVLFGLADQSIAEIAVQRKDVVTRARAGKLTMKDVVGGTFTVSNLGMLGIDRFDAILNPPQVGILAVGSTRRIPVAVGDEVQVRPVATFTLTCDHRAVDGATGAGMLVGVRTFLEQGAW